MLYLIRLEMKKINFSKYIKISFLIYLVYAAFWCLLIWSRKHNVTFYHLENYRDIFKSIHIVNIMTFIIYASVLLSRLVIEEFRSKTIKILSMYPINQKKILFSKILLVMIFTFINIILSDVISTSVFIGFNYLMKIISGEITTAIFMNHTIFVVLSSIEASLICILPLYFGMRNYSVPSTIISSCLIAMILEEYNNLVPSFNLNTILPILLSILGLVVSYHIINKDKNYT